MNAPLYTLDILRLAASLPPPVTLERVDARASERSPTCGSTILTDIQLSDGRIEALSQQVHACAFGQASAALVARHAVGRSSSEIVHALDQLGAWLAGNSNNPPDWGGFEALSPARSRASRHGAILLPLKALSAAFESAA